MEYQLGSFKILMNENRIVSIDGDKSVRPKTLELLAYFLKRPNEVISKQILLDDVWQSAGAQEHVLFQSVNEIRNLFKPLIVIKTHPSKGYQWLHEAEVISQGNASKYAAATTNSPKATIAVVIALVVVFLASFSIIYSQLNSSPDPVVTAADHAPSRELVVLPIDNQIPDSSHNWVRLGGMDMIIQDLTSEQRFAVFEAEEVMMALAQSHSFSSTDIEQQSRNIRAQLGEVVTLHTKLLGAPMEYQVHYSLVGRYNIKQGIIFAAQLPEIFQKLRNAVLVHYKDPLTPHRESIKQQTANSNFLQAMESFFLEDYVAAEHAFSTLLAVQTTNLTAQRYLLKTLMALGKNAKAKVLGESLLISTLAENDQQNHLRTIFELGVLANRQQQFDLSNSLISQSRELAEQHQDTLYIAYAHTALGLLMMQNKHWQQAQQYFQTALEYHRGFQCPYGQINNLSLLAELEQLQNNHQSSLHYLDTATLVAEKNALPYQQVQLLLSRAKYASDIENRQHWLSAAKQIVEQQKDPKLLRYFQGNVVTPPRI